MNKSISIALVLQKPKVISGLQLTSSPLCWCTEQKREHSFGNVILVFCKTWVISCYRFVHQHGRLITWLKTIYWPLTKKVNYLTQCEDWVLRTNFRIPPYCLTVRLALLNLATWAIVSAAKHFSSSLYPSRSLTIVCRPVKNKLKMLEWDLSFISSWFRGNSLGKCAWVLYRDGFIVVKWIWEILGAVSRGTFTAVNDPFTTGNWILVGVSRQWIAWHFFSPR